MATKEERIEAALDTLKEICDMSPEELKEERQYERRSAAEEILRHYRETDTLGRMFTDGILVKIEGHVPVRPVQKAPVTGFEN